MRARTARTWRAKSLATPERVNLEWFGPQNSAQANLVDRASSTDDELYHELTGTPSGPSRPSPGQGRGA